MIYTSEIFECKLIRRYKRFLADVYYEGREMTVHCPNTGSMAGLTDEGNPARISGPHSGTRKYAYTLEQIKIRRSDSKEVWVGVNTSVPELIVEEAALAGKLPGFLNEYRNVKRQVIMEQGTRIDLLLEHDNQPPCWVEIKNVTLVLPNPTIKSAFNSGNVAAFPDAVTARGIKHLKALMKRVEMGERAAMIFVIQRSDGEVFAPAECFDHAYAEAMSQAEETGVNIFPMRAVVLKSGVTLEVKAIPRY